MTEKGKFKTIRLEPEQIAKLNTIAAKDHKFNMSAIIRDAIDAYRKEEFKKEV